MALAFAILFSAYSCTLVSAMLPAATAVLAASSSEPFYASADDSASFASTELRRRLSSCEDIVPDGEEKWYADTTDSVSQRLDCAFFGEFPELCDALVEAHENFNETAEEACCACGGGIRDEKPVKHATRARYDVKQPSSRDSRSASAARALSLPQCTQQNKQKAMNKHLQTQQQKQKQHIKQQWKNLKVNLQQKQQPKTQQ